MNKAYLLIPSIPLSTREQECSEFLLKGKSAKETAKILGLSYRTVEAHITNIKRKLGCRKISALVVKLIDLGYGGVANTI
jgi:DNA-binding CsgD family transcriptional regulator